MTANADHDHDNFAGRAADYSRQDLFTFEQWMEAATIAHDVYCPTFEQRQFAAHVLFGDAR